MYSLWGNTGSKTEFDLASAVSALVRMCQVVVALLCVWCAVVGVSSAEDNTAGEPLFLTPLLEQAKVMEALQLSRVTPDIGNTTSYSGYFTVNNTCGSNLFFWFFPAQNNWTEAPVVLWLQGGPGDSFMLQGLMEISPLTYDDQIGTRELSWNVKNNLLFIDQPVGTGYSFTEKGCYAQSEEDVGRDLYSGVVQLFQLFPELKNNKFYISGVSYGGHYIPALAHTIHINNPTATVKINLAGMMIGNGWMDAKSQIDWANFLHQHGLVDDEGRDAYQTKQDQLVEFIKNKDYEKAREGFTALYLTLRKTFVGNMSLYNYLDGDTKKSSNSHEIYFQNQQTRNAIHVGNMNYSWISKIVSFYLLNHDDIFSLKPWVEELLEHYPMVFYSGQLDVICAYPMVVSFLKTLEWSGRAQFQSSPRQRWCVGDMQAGYYKGAHNLYEVMVRKAGHSVTASQPFWSFILANSVTSDRTANPLHGLTPCK